MAGKGLQYLPCNLNNLFNKYFLTAHHVLVTILDVRDTAVNQDQHSLHSQGTYLLVEKRDQKQFCNIKYFLTILTIIKQHGAQILCCLL